MTYSSFAIYIDNLVRKYKQPMNSVFKISRDRYFDVFMFADDLHHYFTKRIVRYVCYKKFALANHKCNDI